MSERAFNDGENRRFNRKLLQFGTDVPACADCGITDIRCLCRAMTSKKSTARPILCRNCLNKRKILSPAAWVRRWQKFKYAGYDDPACVVCGERDLRALDLDHVAGRSNSSLLGSLCANHHDVKSDLANDPPMDALRPVDPLRSALLRQAAFELGLAAILGMLSAVDATNGDTNRAAFFALVATALVAWAIWNIRADEHLTKTLGHGYDKAIKAEVPS